MGAEVRLMEPMPLPVAQQHTPDRSSASALQLPLALLAIFVLECLIALHTLWPNYPPYALLSLWIGVAPWIRWEPSKTQAPGWSVPLVLGIVVGEAIGYFLVVPWDLTWLCLPRNRDAVTITMFLRLFCILLALSAWITRDTAARGSRTRSRRWTDAGWVVVGLLLILPFALISSHRVLGHRPYFEVAAEAKARLQLGPDYIGYRFFARSVDLVFRPGDSVLIRGSLIAYDVDLGDLQDVVVTWKEPWAGAAEKGRE